VRKVAGENTGNGGSPRLVFSPTAKWEMVFSFLDNFLEDRTPN
jgi:hypothetical protein